MAHVGSFVVPSPQDTTFRTQEGREGKGEPARSPHGAEGPPATASEEQGIRSALSVPLASLAPGSQRLTLFGYTAFGVFMSP